MQMTQNYDAANQVEQGQAVNPARDEQAENEPSRKGARKHNQNTWRQNKKVKGERGSLM